MKKTEFNPTLFMVVSLLAFFLLGGMYFLLSADALYRQISREDNIAAIDARAQTGDEACVQSSEFDMSDPYITKAPGWKKDK